MEDAKAAANEGKTAKTVWNSSDVIAEALRDEGACGHVTAPQPPTFHYGDEARMRGLVAELDGVADAIHKKTGSDLGKTPRTCWRASFRTPTMPPRTATRSGVSAP